MTKSKKKLKQIENEFYESQRLYKQTKDKKYWDKMFVIVNDCMVSAVKYQCKNVKRNDIYDLSMEGTIQIMNRYKKIEDYNIDYLLTVCRNCALCIVHNDKQKRIDNEISLDAWISYEYNKNE